MKLKVCGMKYQDNITEVAQMQPDYLGFIFYKKSSRFFDTAIPQLPESIKKVGVFVEASVDDVIKNIRTHNLQAVQLHGKESPEFCRELRARHAEFISESFDKSLKLKSHESNNGKSKNAYKYLQDDRNEKPVISSGVEIIKVFSIKNDFNFSVLEPYEDLCDYYLFDTKGKLPGGNGYTFNWEVLNNYPSTKPFFLSGGIGLHEIEKLNAFKKTQASTYCYAVDVNSKFEIEAGLKHIKELEKFKKSI